MENKTERLAKIIKKLNSGEDPAMVKSEAQDFLSSISAEDLTFTEQQLIEAGLKPEDLRHLCSAHMEMLGDEANEFKNNLSKGHVLHTLVSEHEMILGFLDKLEKANEEIQKMTNFYVDDSNFKIVTHVAEHLEGAEPHHQREEEVLFPAVEERGVYGPTEIMRMEHKDLRRYKKDLIDLAGKFGAENFEETKKRLETTVKFILLTLRDHIFKENNILYPAALGVITDANDWNELKKKCDEIGYCCFTPET
jgi:DUF438 domain-containing protein